MKFVSTVKLKNILSELQDKFPRHEFIEREHIDNLTEEDFSTVDVLISYHDLSRELLNQMPNLKWIAYYAAGVNSVPLDYIEKRNIVLTNARGVHKVQISEFIFAYIMADYKKLYEYRALQSEHGFKTKIRTDELYHRTIAFLGTGEIAKRAAKLAQAFDMKTIGLNTNGRAIEYFDEVYSMDDRVSAFKAADIIVNVLPSTDATTDLLSLNDFEAMGCEALFINVGRGTVVKEEILLEALKNNVIRQAALDVYYEEPLKANHPLYELDNVIMTPHITGNSKQYNRRATEILIRNIELGLDNASDFENLVDINKGY